WPWLSWASIPWRTEVRLPLKVGTAHYGLLKNMASERETWQELKLLEHLYAKPDLIFDPAEESHPDVPFGATFKSSGATLSPPLTLFYEILPRFLRKHNHTFDSLKTKL